nr:hypothetical protein [Nocardia brevicatena]
MLDNCEHILDSVGPVIADILYTVPRLTILATSRTMIGWSDEYLVEVPQLPAQDASALFLHRAQALGHPIEGADQLAAVDAICRHMQNTPLFIRLAAARLRQRPLAGILQDLDRANSGDQHMGWSSGPSTTGDIRHHSIGDAIAWSYELCSDKERLLFERLSVFAAGYGIDPDYNGFTIGAEPEAIVEVCSDDTIAPAPEGFPPDPTAVRLSREEIPSLLDHLVDRSLVSLQIRENSVRYSLMERLHVFARQRLEARGIGTTSEQARLSRRHLRYYHDALHRAAVDWVGPQEQHVFDWLRTAWPNLMVAVHTSSATPVEAALGLRICIAIHAFPPITHTASIREIRMWTERALKATDSTPEDYPHTRTTAKALVAYSALRQGMGAEAERLLDECLTACGVRPDRRTAPEPAPGLPAAVEFVWGMILWTLHNDAHAVPLLAGAQRKALDSSGVGFAAVYGSAAAGAAARMSASDRQVDEVVDEMFQRAESTESPWTTTWAYLIKAIVSIERGDPSTALEFIHRTQGRNLSASDQLGWVLLLRAWALGQTVVDTADTAGRNRLVDHALPVRGSSSAAQQTRAGFPAATALRRTERTHPHRVEEVPGSRRVRQGVRTWHPYPPSDHRVRGTEGKPVRTPRSETVRRPLPYEKSTLGRAVSGRAERGDSRVGQYHQCDDRRAPRYIHAYRRGAIGFGAQEARDPLTPSHRAMHPG